MPFLHASLGDNAHVWQPFSTEDERVMWLERLSAQLPDATWDVTETTEPDAA